MTKVQPLVCAVDLTMRVDRKATMTHNLATITKVDEVGEIPCIGGAVMTITREMMGTAISLTARTTLMVQTMTECARSAKGAETITETRGGLNVIGTTATEWTEVKEIVIGETWVPNTTMSAVKEGWTEIEGEGEVTINTPDPTPWTPASPAHLTITNTAEVERIDAEETSSVREEDPITAEATTGLRAEMKKKPNERITIYLRSTLVRALDNAIYYSVEFNYVCTSLLLNFKHWCDYSLLVIKS